MIELRNMKTKTLSQELLRRTDAYLQVAKYLSVGQIYLYGIKL